MTPDPCSQTSEENKTKLYGWISLTNNKTTISTARQDFFFSSFIPLQGGLSCATTTRPALSEQAVSADTELFPETVAQFYM